MPYLGNTPSTSFATVTKDTFSGDGSTVAFTLSKIATTNSVSAFVSNVRQEPTTAYAVSGTTLTFTSAPPNASNNIYVLHMNPTSTATHPAAQNLTAVDGTFTGDVTITDDLNVGDDLTLGSDGAIIKFGADSEITLTHSADAGLLLKTTSTSDDTYPSLVMQTGDTDIAVSDLLGRVAFQAPDEGTGTDAIVVGADIIAFSEGNFAADNNATSLSLRTASSGAVSTVLQAKSTGDIHISSGDITFGGAGKGINLGVTSNTDSNTLDDYEEGTFTFGTNANIGLNTSSNVGNYTKIGRIVHVQLMMDLSSVSGTNHVYVSGMPFTSVAHTSSTYNGNAFGSVSLYNVDFDDDANFTYAVLGQSSTTVYMYHSKDNANWDVMINSELTSSAEIGLSITYTV